MDLNYPLIDIHTHFLAAFPKVAQLNLLTEDSIPKSSFFSVGMHPWYLGSTEQNREAQFERLKSISAHPHCLSIGECGLDRLRGPDLKIQLYWLERQTTWALQQQLPMVIHCVKAFDILLKWLKDQPELPNTLIHGFRKKPVLLKQLQDKGCLFSFGEKGLKSKSGRDSLRSLPLQAFFLETDHDSGASIEATYRLAAAIKGVTVDDLRRELWTNFMAVFKPDLSNYKIA